MSLRRRRMPVPSPVAGSSNGHRKVLIVEVDYFCLSTRVDPNVIFWNGKQANLEPAIPEGITDIWISPYTLKETRWRLIPLAKERNIRIWRVTDHFDLRVKLLPIWGIPSNRSLIVPAEPGESLTEFQEGLDLRGVDEFYDSDPEQVVRVFDDVVDASELTVYKPRSEDEDDEPIRARATRRGAAKLKRLELLRKAHARYLARINGTEEPDVPPPPRPKDTARIESALTRLSTIESNVFRRSVLNAEVALQIASALSLPASNIPRIVERTWTKLAALGISKADII